MPILTMPRLRARGDTAGSRVLADAGFAALALVSAAIVVAQTQGTTFFADDWNWIAYRRGDSLAAFLDPYNGHLSLLPIAIMRALYATFGIRSYVPYRALLLVLELVVAGLVYAYARSRLTPTLALAAGATILFFGPGWVNLEYPIQVTYQLAMLGGLGALLALDRPGRRAEAAAALLLAVSLASQSLGLAFALAVAIDVLARADRRSGAWVLVGPIGLYGVWWVGWQDASAHWTILGVASTLANLLSATAADLCGLAGHTIPDRSGTQLVFGPPLAIIAGLVLAWRSWARGGDRVRQLALAAALIAFGILIGLARGGLSHGEDSRYVGVAAVLAVALIAEVFTDVRPPAWGTGLLAVCVAAAVVSNVSLLRAGGTYLHGIGVATRADLAAIDIARPALARDAGYVADGLPGWPFVLLRSGPYFAAVRADGTPAASPAELATMPEGDRLLADAQLVGAERIVAMPVPAATRGLAPRGLTAPTDPIVAGGEVARTGGCLRLAPAAAGASLAVRIPAAGARIIAPSGARVAVRRFAAAWTAIGAVSSTTSVRPIADASTRPWSIRATDTTRRPIAVCADG